MRIFAVMWGSHCDLLRRAGKEVSDILELEVYGSRGSVEEILERASKADLVLLYRSTDPIWDAMEGGIRELGKRIPIICLGRDPSYWTLSTVRPDIVATVHSYITMGGEENFADMLRYIAKEVWGMDVEVRGLKPIPWEGIYHPDAPSVFSNVDEYLSWYMPKDAPFIGMIFSRSRWANGDLYVEDTLIRALEAVGLNAIPVFCHMRDEELGTRGEDEVVLDYFVSEDGRPRVDAVIRLRWFSMGSGNRIEALKKLDVPIFSPVVSYYKSFEEWESDGSGLGSEVGWAVAMPEFDGMIEPIIVGTTSRDREGIGRQIPIEERCLKVARRVARWIGLRRKPREERKVAFFLHNNPCASVEGTVGAGAKLDTLESVARILRRMEEAGYRVESPTSGKELIETIMERKAISEFRWTTTDEIVSKGGALALVSEEEYKSWFSEIPENTRMRICEAWGEPPGDAMVYDGRIVVTGVSYGNAVVCVQPKRGCAGPRCDGQVCKILHDPDIPPPHQYIATYRYIERVFGADLVVHVGTHGNLEFLPGKGVGLSGACLPDIAIGDLPHLYIYNSDNPPEGTIAKRRSYAVLVDHMQTAMTHGGLYDELEELDKLLLEYERICGADPARAHALRHSIEELLRKTNLDSEIKDGIPFDEMVREAHGILGRIRNTQIQDGMHIFGQIPEGERRVEFINSILRYDPGDGTSIRAIVASIMGVSLMDLLSDQGGIHPDFGMSKGRLLEEIELLGMELIRGFLSRREASVEEIAREVLGDKIREGRNMRKLEALRERVLEIDRRINESREIDSLLHGFDGGYIPPGPSGLITRGREDVLPTGRNFYSVDPYNIPTKAAWKVGERLARVILDKHLREEGRYPENIAFYWMANDIMWADGEGMAQMLALLGVRPLWQPNGRVKGLELIPLEELGRPRIDITVRVSGITRDNFPNCIELLDEAIQMAASVEEPPDMNYVRKHAMAYNGDWRDATLRIFSAKPGTYSAGVQLAVYASAWKEEKDLADIFLYWNGDAYGKGIFGEAKHKALKESLKTVDITYNKVVTDESDLLSCCCYFGTHGGMTAAARSISGKGVKSYYGDTREPENVEVRTLAEEVRRVVRTKLLNPRWIEGMKRHGYKGAGDISKRAGRVYGWQATTREVDGWVFDEIARTFLMDEENRRFFEENNPWALEEIARRLIEAIERELWKPSPDVERALKEVYLEIEGWIEDKMGDIRGEFQGGSIDIVTKEDVESWRKKLEEVLG